MELFSVWLFLRIHEWTVILGPFFLKLGAAVTMLLAWTQHEIHMLILPLLCAHVPVFECYLLQTLTVMHKKADKEQKKTHTKALSVSNNLLVAISNQLISTFLLSLSSFLCQHPSVPSSSSLLLFSPPSFPAERERPSALICLFSRGCIILALTNYRSMAKRAIKRFCAGRGVKKR